MLMKPESCLERVKSPQLAIRYCVGKMIFLGTGFLIVVGVCGVNGLFFVRVGDGLVLVEAASVGVFFVAVGFALKLGFF